MKATLIVEGKEFEVNINHPELEELLKPKKKTGYERVANGSEYFYVSSDASVGCIEDERDASSNDDYDAANYYSDRTVAENNARADKLMRQLRRYAVEQKKSEIDWLAGTCKYVIKYSYLTTQLYTQYEANCRSFGGIFFDSEEVAKNAIMFYRDELIWYFTEYKDSL